jgi:hypothetical protein
VDFEGRISDLAGRCPNLEFTVAGRAVRTNRGTDFRKMDCGDIRNRLDVRVKGVVQTDGSVLASRIEEADD